MNSNLPPCMNSNLPPYMNSNLPPYNQTPCMNGTNSAVLHKTDSLHEQMGAVICWGGSMKKTGFYVNLKT